MFRRIAATVASLVLIGSYLTVGGGIPVASAMVAPAPGSGPDSALPVPVGPTSVAVGQRIWYGFQYAGDGSPILVDMSAAPGGSAGFAVYTPGETATPVGRGNPQTMTRRLEDGTIEEASLYGGDLIWSGGFPSPGVYYVVVDQAGPTPATINLKVTGSGVSALPGVTAPAPASTKIAAPDVACTPVAPTETLTAAGPGSTPDQALPLPSEQAYLLPAGQRAWYAFQYNGDGSQILLDLRATPDNSARFAVYTPGEPTTPVGRGSQQSTTRRRPDGTLVRTTLYGGDLIWSGNFRSPGVYYVAVDQIGPKPSTIRLGVNGSGVSGGQALTSLPGVREPGQFCAPQPTAVPTPGTVTAGGPGSTPAQALPLPSEGAYLLPAGQRAWYAFQYRGDGSQIVIELGATPEDSAKFAVYTPGPGETPVGHGSKQTMTRRRANGTLEEVTLYGGNPVWSGNFRSPGVYYVAVDQTGANPSTIALKVTGSGVSTPPAR